VYEDRQRVGSFYFHACPPIDNPAHQPDGSARRYDPRETVARPDARDENVVLEDVTGERGIRQLRAAGIKAEGRGRRQLRDDEV
jgi:hypothetical protein